MAANVTTLDPFASATDPQPGAPQADWEEIDRKVWQIARSQSWRVGMPAEDLHGAGILRLLTDWPKHDPSRHGLEAFVACRAKYAMVDHARDWRHSRTHGHGVMIEPLNGHGRVVGAEQVDLVLAGEAWAAVMRLPARWAAVLRWYYGPEQLTMRECGVRLGVNESRVSQIHKAAIGRLRKVMGMA